MPKKSEENEQKKTKKKDHPLLENIEKEDTSEEGTMEPGSSFFNHICININNMNNSSVNLGNNDNCRPVLNIDPEVPTLPVPGGVGVSKHNQRQKKRKKPGLKKRNSIHKKARVEVNFPGMVKKNKRKKSS